MTNSEFSDAFSTLLNSYNTQSQFGEQYSKRDIVLDEYEKSVLLTQAQDIIVKSHFDRSLNQEGQGFDDSTRRQMDFSSLIKVANLTALDKEVSEPLKFDERGLIYQLPRKKVAMPEGIIFDDDSTIDTTGKYIKINGDNSHVLVASTTDVLFILNEKLILTEVLAPAVGGVHYTQEEINDAQFGDDAFGKTTDDWKVEPTEAVYRKKEYVIVPINYKEYDREMSKPYAQPLKKQAWRLFQNQTTGFDTNSELIPKFNINQKGDGNNVGDIVFLYKIRYVKRPKPIILETLPNELEIDGENEFSECELNPIIHMDILNKAVELAIATRGGGTQRQESNNS